MGILKTLTINGVQYAVTPIVPADSVTLLASAWEGDGDAYSQVVEVPGVTAHTKIDLQPTAEQLAEFHYKVLAFVAENDNGTVTVYSIGDKPANDHTIQITKTEVQGTGLIRGNTVGTSMPRPDWAQTDPRKADYIHNKPDDIVCDASGSTISVNDSSDRQPKSLALCGKTTQDGTPKPDAPVDLVTAGASGTINVSVTGKNLFDYDTHAANGFQSTIPVVAGKTLYRNARASSPSAWTLYDTDGNSLGTFSTLGFTTSNPLVLPANASYIITTDSSSSVIYDMYVGYDSDTTYEPYACQTLTAQTPNGLPGIPVASGGNYTDENGQQWICDEIDFARGVRVQRIGVVDFATLTWKATTYKNDIQKGYYTTISGIYDSRNSILHSHYFWDGWISGSEAATNVLGASQAAFNAREIGEIGFSSKGTGKNQIGVVVGINDGTPVGTLQYVLSEPIETPLTAEELAQGVALHTNKPNTTVYNDAGAGMKLSYVADTKAYIDKKFNELAAAIINNT